MKAPDKIYVGIQDLGSGYATSVSITPQEGHSEYIRKDALLEWAKEKIAQIDAVLKIGYDQMALAQRVMLVSVIDKLQSL